MKVKHKCSGIELDLPGWELADEERWEDVTSRCEWDQRMSGDYYIKDTQGGARIEGQCVRPWPYRVRKIQIDGDRAAFIVERRA